MQLLAVGPAVCAVAVLVVGVLIGKADHWSTGAYWALCLGATLTAAFGYWLPEILRAPKLERTSVSATKRSVDDDKAQAGAGALDRLRDARVGADRDGDGYAVYFYDDNETEVFVVGGFASSREASDAVPVIRARAVLDAVAKLRMSGKGERGA